MAENSGYEDRRMTAEQAVARIKSGSHVVVGSGAAEPQRLVEALSRRRAELSDVEMTHLLTLGSAPYVTEGFEGHLRHNALFIGPNVREAVAAGLADYTPCFLSEVPGLMRSGRLPVDVALISVTPPQDGVCSLGVSIDIVKAAADVAEYVVAQVNPRMPWTLGDSFMKVSDIDAFVQCEEPMLELKPTMPTAAALWIGRYVSRLVNDGDTIQIGIGTMPEAVLAALANKKDLGIHSEMISDGVMLLQRKGIVTGRRKNVLSGKIVASFCMGTQALYEEVDRNPVYEFYPSDFVNCPSVISQNERMVSINAAIEVDLTGQVNADSIGHRFYSGVGGQVDFIRGAAWSKGGRSIIALASTANGGLISRIKPFLEEGAGVVTTRADVDFVVTEYGIASLKGKTIRERAVALIGIAHPRHRAALVEAAKRFGYLDAGHVLPAGAGAYRADYEVRRRFKDLDVLMRPLKPSDERRLKDLFYSQSMETTISRFGIPLKRLSEQQFQELVAIDYTNSLAIGAFAREGQRERIIGVGRYYLEPMGKLAEAAFTVHDKYQGMGIGTFLIEHLSQIARLNGLEGFAAEVKGLNPAMARALDHCFVRRARESVGVDGTRITVKFSDLKSGATTAVPAGH